MVFCRERKAQGQPYQNRHSKPEFTQCRERVFALIQRGRDVRGLASERRLLKRRYLHQRQGCTGSKPIRKPIPRPANYGGARLKTWGHIIWNLRMGAGHGPKMTTDAARNFVLAAYEELKKFGTNRRELVLGASGLFPLSEKLAHGVDKLKRRGRLREGSVNFGGEHSECPASGGQQELHRRLQNLLREQACWRRRHRRRRPRVAPFSSLREPGGGHRQQRGLPLFWRP